MTATGSDISAVCSKCGDVWHVIVAMVGDKIAKVQCKECGAYHRYKSAADKASAKRTRTSGGSSSKPRTPPPPPVATVEPDLSKPIRPYSIRDLFEPGERIDHPSFGIGVVENDAEPGKITVFFPQGRKVLAQAKKSSKLERPAPLNLPRVEE